MLRRHKIIEGKQHCDCCERKEPPIRECSWPCGPGSHRYYWMDLCGPCQQRLQGLFEQGVGVGPTGFPEAPRSQAASTQPGILEKQRR